MSRNIFVMGSDWNVVKQKYKLSNNDMFDYFNKPILDDALSSGKIIRFSHNPLGDDGFLGMEWDHIKSMTGLSDSNLFYEEDFGMSNSYSVDWEAVENVDLIKEMAQKVWGRNVKFGEIIDTSSP